MNTLAHRTFPTIAAGLLVCAAASCAKHEEASSAPAVPASNVATEEAKAETAQAPAHPPIDAGTLLTDEDIQAIAGAPVKDRKMSERTDRGLAVSQCYFELPSAADSMVLAVWEGAGAGDTRAKKAWKEIFERDFDKEEEGEKEEKKTKPAKIDGLGEEAFVIPQRFGGVLYVLKGPHFFRLSVGGGPGDTQEKKLATLKAAAEAVLKKL
ncbi:MAG: hypothetical protein M3Y69_07075 [Verrucomicrobiota bacterium]|nr:hypothetical protein [Verrucomicrobiota bacterium]